MDQRKAFFFFGFMVLVWSIFWHGAIRMIAIRHAAKQPNKESAAVSGLLISA